MSIFTKTKKVETTVAMPQIISSVEMVRSMVMPMRTLSDLNHIARVEQVTGRQILSGFNPDNIEALQKAGMRLFIRARRRMEQKWRELQEVERGKKNG